MNPIEKDLRSYFGITSESNILEHYGTKRHSGRYPWGSGDNPYQHSGDFLSRVEVLKKKGLSEKDILESINDSLPKEYQMSLSEFRVAKRTAIHERKTSEYEQIHMSSERMQRKNRPKSGEQRSSSSSPIPNTALPTPMARNISLS